MIDKINDEFIVDCTNNSKEERQQVYKFLVDNRNYEKSYLEEYFPVIVCNKKQNNSNWDSLEKYYNWVDSKKDIPIYTFEQFKKYVLKQDDIENNKKIIGYKLIKPEYEEAVLKIVGSPFLKLDSDNRGFHLYIEDCFIKKVKDAGVLNLWFEPVFFKEKIMIGEYEVKFNQNNYGKKSCVINKNAYHIDQLIELKNLFKTSNGQIKSLNVGCNGQYKVDLNKIEEIIKRLT